VAAGAVTASVRIARAARRRIASMG
jgi:hypothetical protein